MQYSGERFILTNPDIFSDSHLPLEIQHRESQLNDLKLCLYELTEFRRPIHGWFFGKPGTGKTVTALYVMQEIESEKGIKGIYVNCWENPTIFSVLECIARELRLLGAEKLSTSFKLERLKRALSGERMIIVLDEIDQPSPKELNAILYNLSQFPAVDLICVCNSQNKYYSLEERVKSRLNPARIHFNEYSTDELLKILSRRAEFALVPGSYSEPVLNEISQLAQGDARIAIQTLKNAASLAQKDHQGQIGLYHVKQAWNAAKELKMTYLLRKLTDHHRLLYELIKRKGNILSGDLWRLYLKKCKCKKIMPIAVRTYSEYCNKLVEIGIVQAKRAAIQGKVREFTVIR